LRFALHRPGQVHRVSTRCHGPSGRGIALCDVACRVDIGVGPVPTGQAKEHRLALTVPLHAMPTDVTRQRCVGRVDPMSLPETTSSTNNTPTSQGFLPTLNGRVSAPTVR
jgi:hypothetical protein